MGKALPESLNGRAIPVLKELDGFETWIYHHWQEIGRSRINTDSGPQPITDANIRDYMALMDEDFSYIELTLIKDLDKAYLAEINVQQDINRESSQ